MPQESRCGCIDLELKIAIQAAFVAPLLQARAQCLRGRQLDFAAQLAPAREPQRDVGDDAE